MNTGLPRRVSLLHVVEPSDRSVSNHPPLSSELGLLMLRGVPRGHASRATPLAGPPASWASPFTRRLATTTGRIEFVSYGPVLRLRLLPTSSCDDAVTVGYNV